MKKSEKLMKLGLCPQTPEIYRLSANGMMDCEQEND